jgi:aliphatic nitrilase
MGDTFPKLRLAAVQAAPVFLNREASVEKAVKLIKEAGTNGADFVGFPENFIPGHPLWYYFDPANGKKAMRLATELYKNAVVIDSEDVRQICRAAAEANVYVVMGLTEKLPNQTGGMFNTQLYIDRNGRIIGKHQKMAPTIGEKMVHMGGSARYLRSVPTEFGPVSGMICGENTNPMAVMAMSAEYTRIHVAAWPNHFMPDHWASMHQSILIASRNVAYACKCFVIAAAGTVSPEMVDLLAHTDDDRAFLTDPKKTGGSAIIDPTGNIIAGPLDGDKEGILYADVDLEHCVTDRFVHDFGGGYNRPDQLQLLINDHDNVLVHRTSFGAVNAWPQVAESPLGLEVSGQERVPARSDRLLDAELN